MGRWSSYPLLLDETKTISIANLKRLGYLRDGHRGGRLEWSCRGQPVGDVSITVNLSSENRWGYLELYYRYQKEYLFHYKIPLVATPTNLGIGLRWYFECPRTGKRCIKLYMANGYFQHRSGISGAMYSSQTESHFTRLLTKIWKPEKLLERPYLKRHYRGRLTPRYQRAKRAIANAEGLDVLLLARLSR